MIAYLDYNIITSLDQNEFTLEKIHDNVNGNIDRYPFSAAHIQEVDNITSNDDVQRNSFIKLKLDTIEEISKGLYLYQELPSNKVFFQNERPAKVLETIREVPFAKTAMQSFANLIPAAQKKQIRETMGINMIEINNYSSDIVIEHLNTKLSNWGTNDSFLGLLDKAIECHPDGKSFGMHNKIAGVFELLDFLGYWKDKDTTTSNYARLWDSNHTHFATYCDYFISDDKRARNKAKVVYELYDVQTIVISSDGTE